MSRPTSGRSAKTSPVLSCEAGAIVVACLALACHPARAERADRGKPISIESDGNQPGMLDLDKRTAVLTGHVAITQGTLEIHAARVEISEDRAGPRLAIAIGAPGMPARFRQKVDRPDEWSEGDASRIEYDSAANLVRFIGDAHLRILHGAAVTDSASAAVLAYDTDARTVATGGGRVTIVIAPRSASDAQAAQAGESP